MKPPSQQRSQQTLDRILDAAEQLLNEKAWADITVQEIVREAHSSVGSFYARFGDKQTLLASLSERLSRHAAEAAAQDTPVNTADLDSYLGTVIARLLNFFRQRHGLIRALTLIPRLAGDDSLRHDGLRNAGIFDDLVGSLAAIADHPDRTRMALFLAVTAIREHVIFPENTQPLIELDDNRFALELTHLLVAYLRESR